MIGAEDLSCVEIISSLQGAFGRTQCTIYRWCIIAPSNEGLALAVLRCRFFLSLLNQQVQFLLNGFAMKDESQKFHHIIVRQQGRLSQKLLQHSGTSAKAVGSFASGQLFQLVFQLLFLVLGCCQFLLQLVLLLFQFFQFFTWHRGNSFQIFDNGQNKRHELFTVRAFWLGHYSVLFCLMSSSASSLVN